MRSGVTELNVNSLLKAEHNRQGEDIPARGTAYSAVWWLGMACDKCNGTGSCSILLECRGRKDAGN